MYIYKTSTYVDLYFCCIRCYTCIQIFLLKLHLHETPSHVFIICLKTERFSSFLICGGSLFHIFGPKTLKLFSLNFTWLALRTFKFRYWWLWIGLSNDLTSKRFDKKHGLNWCRVLNISRQSVELSLLICLNFLKYHRIC